LTEVADQDKVTGTEGTVQTISARGALWIAGQAGIVVGSVQIVVVAAERALYV
jgi:hypothetical protein